MTCDEQSLRKNPPRIQATFTHNTFTRNVIAQHGYARKNTQELLKDEGPVSAGLIRAPLKTP